MIITEEVISRMPLMASADEVAKLFGVTTSTVYRWARSGQLKSKHAFNRIVFTKSDISEFVGYQTTDAKKVDELNALIGGESNE